MSQGSPSNPGGPNATEFAPGRVIAGKYQVERVLGGGGMGVILLGRHTELDQRVAIKALRPDALKEPEMVARFTREARALARLKSEHVARVIDVGKEGQSPFMVMEYLKGKDLSELQKERGRFTPEDTLTYVLQAMEAIAEAHQLGIVHRDIKPANLFFTTRSDGSPLIKVLDFGISKVAQPNGALTEDPLTNTSMMMGSPHYMPPEQLKDARSVDGRADIWSLGVVLYRLLSGQHAFKAATTAELCVFILVNPHPTLQSCVPDAPPGLSEVIDRCLEKAPSARYQTIAELARALEPFAPAGAKISIERISRMAGAAPMASAPPPSFPAIDAPALADVTSTSVDAHVPQVTSLTSTRSLERSAGLSRRAGGSWLLVAGAVVAVVGIGAVFAVMMGLRTRHRATPAALVEAPRTMQPSASASVPLPDPSSAAVATPSAAASGTTRASAVGAPPAVSGRPGPALIGAGRPKVVATSASSAHPTASAPVAPPVTPAVTPDPGEFGGRK
jgi:serine/threonine-protein kinase